MGFWDYINSVGDQVKGITPDLSTVKNATYNHTSAAVTKINQVVSNQKLYEYLSDPEIRAQIGAFTATLAKNTGKYVVYEGVKHIPGVNVAHKLISDTMREVKQKNQRDGMKAIEEKVEKLEKDTETRAQIVAHKLILDTAREVQQKNQGDEMKTTEEKVERLEKDTENRTQIGLFTTTIAKNTGKYALYEGFMYISVQPENQTDGMKAMEENVER